MKNSKSLREEDPIRLPYFDWDKAKYFYYIAKLGSFSEMGKFLNISQPSLSRKISILEDHLKCKLFTRTPKGLELTRKGEELFAIVEQSFLSLKGFTYNAAVTANNGQKRKIRISTTHPIAAYMLNEHLISYSQLHPDIVFEVIGDDQLIDLIINDVDIAIRPFNPEAKGLQQEPLFTLEKKLYASPKYLAKYGEPKTVEELKTHHLVAQTNPTRHPYSDIHWILRLGMDHGEVHQPVYTSNSLECLIEAVREGIGIISCYEEMKIIKENGFKQVLKSITSNQVMWHCIYPNNLKDDKQFQEFKQFLLEKFSPLRDSEAFNKNQPRPLSLG